MTAREVFDKLLGRVATHPRRTEEQPGREVLRLTAEEREALAGLTAADIYDRLP